MRISRRSPTGSRGYDPGLFTHTALESRAAIRSPLSKDAQTKLLRRELGAHLGVRCQIQRGLSLLVLARAVGAAREEKVDYCGIAQVGGDHQRGASAIVGVVER